MLIELREQQSTAGEQDAKPGTWFSTRSPLPGHFEFFSVILLQKMYIPSLTVTIREEAHRRGQLREEKCQPHAFQSPALGCFICSLLQWRSASLFALITHLDVCFIAVYCLNYSLLWTQEPDCYWGKSRSPGNSVLIRVSIAVIKQHGQK